MSDGEHRLDYAPSAARDDGRNSFIVGIVLIVIDSSAWAYWAANRSDWLFTLLAFLAAWLISLLLGIWGLISGLKGFQHAGNPRRYAIVGLVINSPIAAVAIYYAVRWLGAA